jgi:hypothetical protein
LDFARRNIKSRSAAGCVETGFARFVYCLGGREPQIVSPSVEPNAGAAQYWKLLHDALYGPSHPHSGLMRSGEPNAQRRLENKLSLLHGLRASGIWLEDASISALYRAGKRVTRRPSWDYYVSEVVRSSAPVAVIVIGEYVNRLAMLSAKISVTKSMLSSSPTRGDRRQQVFGFCQP